MARIEEVMGDACAYSTTTTGMASTSGGHMNDGGQTQPQYTPDVPMTTGGEHHGTRSESSTPLRRSATWSPSSAEPKKRSTWSERRKKLQMARDVERRRRSKPFDKFTSFDDWVDGKPPVPQPPAPATPAAWCPDPSWEDYAEFKTAGWVQNDKQVDDIAAALAKW